MEYVNCADFSVNSVAPRGLCECECVCVCVCVCVCMYVCACVDYADLSGNSIEAQGCVCVCVCVCVCLSVNCADLATKSYTPTLLHLVTKDNSVFF